MFRPFDVMCGMKGALFLVKHISVLLWGFIRRPHLFVHSSRCVVAFWRFVWAKSKSVLLLHTIRSSAYARMVVLLGAVRSESRIENRVGLSTEPCGTPLLTGVGVERVSPTTTEKVLFVRKFWNHVSTFPVILQ